MKKIVFLFVMLLGLPIISAAQTGRTIDNFDANWKFQLGDVANASKVGFSDRSWRTLNLPHDWSIEGENLQDAPGGGSIGYFPTGIGWYRKTFDVAGYSANRLYSIEFDGVYMNSEVWINGHYLGKWPYGYSSFSYDLTPYLKAKRNVIAVRVDNSQQPNSRWYTGSGIYRHVRLVSTDKLRFSKWGVFAYTETLENGKASLKIEAEVLNDSAAKNVKMTHALLDADGKEVASTSKTVANATESVSLSVANPHLWDTEDPYMYTLKSTLAVDGKVLDVVETPVGVRTILYDIDKGFFLNGKHVKMYGVNLHHDAGAVGAAVPERVWERRIEILKSGGCNAIRTAHNIPSPEFLDLCDKHGMLVMDEAFDMWINGKNKYDYQIEFEEWHEKDLSCMVLRDRNHPSVVMWSIGNEVPDQSSDVGPALAREMIDLCHKLDPTRLVTSGNDRIIADDNPASEEFLAQFENDIVGYNYPDRWRSRRETNYTDDKIAHPNRRVVATEAGGLSGSRCVRSNRSSRYARPGYVAPPTSASFIDTEQRWRYAIINDFVIGDFMWTGIDYYGETRWPSRGAGSGYLDNCGFKKDGYYFFKSIWTKEPVLHLVGGWNPDPSKAGTISQVVVFTNCGYVELFLNGKSYGVKTHEFPRLGNVNSWAQSPEGKVQTTTADLHLTWDLPQEPGEVKLVGKIGDKEYVQVFRTAGAPAEMKVTLDRNRIKADPTDVVHVTVEILDENGTVVPSADNLIKFDAPSARIIGVESGDMSDLSSTKASERKAYGGMCLAIIQADKAGEYNVTVSAEGLKPVTVKFVAE